MSKKRILVIDDEKLIVKSTCMALQLYDLDAFGALSGKEGLDEARLKRPDIILLDIMMPNMDGWDVLKALKADPITASIPVIIFTAREYSNGPEMARQKGALDYVAKPFELEDLAILIHRSLSGGE
ncbi:MAG: hypothetical protein A2293_01135 [Elusimicrobia bacterium RIFOXYB2_FULL_49_7]|nr:MAG: hypothetical protein A2293_01135 [Elusimicrobia bacterium RIFOXYB2_FULL_49_7]